VLRIARLVPGYQPGSCGNGSGNVRRIVSTDEGILRSVVVRVWLGSNSIQYFTASRPIFFIRWE
jgi:hypothetical protein